MKSKNAPQTMTRRLLKYVPLLIALGVVAAWIWFVQYSYGFPNPNKQTTIFYPLMQLKSSHFVMLFVAVMCLLILVHVISKGSRIIRGFSLLYTTVIVGLYFLQSLYGGLSFTQYDTATNGERTYRLLIFENEANWGQFAGMIDAYTVIACESSGNWCSYKSTPYLKEQHCQCFSKDAHLKFDGKGHLLLVVGQDVYSVETEDVFEQCRLMREKWIQTGTRPIFDQTCPSYS
jgi:hypothetical protein